jgi:hypothetical protein
MMINRSLSTLALTLAATAAVAAPPYSPNLTASGGEVWRMTAFTDSDPGHAQALFGGFSPVADYCFFPAGVVGEHMAYRWYSLTFKGAAGTARQEGDKVWMHGDFPTHIHGYTLDAGHESARFELVSGPKKTKGYGEQVVWLETGRYGRPLGFVNIELVRTGKE